jgi:hypothetical protein
MCRMTQMPRHIYSIVCRIDWQRCTRHLYIRREKSEQMWVAITRRLLCIGYGGDSCFPHDSGHTKDQSEEIVLPSITGVCCLVGKQAPRSS